jgi:hypothetical protein
MSADRQINKLKTLKDLALALQLGGKVFAQ